MNKLFKKLYAVLGVLVMLLPIALSAVSGSVKAEPVPEDKQTVVLTKLGFRAGTAPTATENGKPWANEYNAVSGVEFEIYDVTEAFKALNKKQKNSLREVNKLEKTQTDKDTITKNEGDIRVIGTSAIKEDGITPETASSQDLIGDLKPLQTVTTGENGTATIDLPSDHKYYIFREVIDETKTYQPSKDLLLSLPQIDKELKTPLDKVYLYPKNYAEQSMELVFKKVDSTNNEPLSGAKFILSKTIGNDTLYAQKVFTTKGEDGTIKSELVTDDSDYNNISWTADHTHAAVFTSGKDGKFSVKAKPISSTNNDFSSFRKVSDSSFNKYGIAVGDKISFEEIEAPDGYDKLPKGSFTVMAKDAETASSHVKSEDTEADYKLYLESADAKIFTFEDDPTGLLPHTGGMGIVLFVLAGVTLIAVGAYAYKKQRA